MQAKIIVECDGREVEKMARELTESPSEIEEQVRAIIQQAGRTVLSGALQEFADVEPAPCCCGGKMKNRGFCPIDLLTTFGEVTITRRRYRCQKCQRELYPADGHVRCHNHRVTQPLAKMIYQLATVEHFTRLPELVDSQHGVALAQESILELVHDVGMAANELRMAAAAAPLPQRRIAPLPECPAPKTIT